MAEETPQRQPEWANTFRNRTPDEIGPRDSNHGLIQNTPAIDYSAQRLKDSAYGGGASCALAMGFGKEFRTSAFADVGRKRELEK